MATTNKHFLEISNTRTILKGSTGGLAATELKPNQRCISQFGSVYRTSFRDKSGGTTGVYHECLSIDLTAGVDSDKRISFFDSNGQMTSSVDLSFDSANSLLTIGSGGNYGTLQRNASDFTLYSTDTLILNAGTDVLFTSSINEIGSHTGYSLLSIKQKAENALGALNIRQSGDHNTWALFQGSDETLNFYFATNASGANSVGDFAVKLVLNSNGNMTFNNGSKIESTTGSSNITFGSSSLDLKGSSSIVLDSAGYISLESSIINCGVSHTGYGCVDIKQPTDDHMGGIHIRQRSTNDTWAINQDTDERLIFGYAANSDGGDDNAEFNSALRIDRYGSLFSGDGSTGGFYIGEYETSNSWSITNDATYFKVAQYDGASYVDKLLISDEAILLDDDIDLHTFSYGYTDYSSISSIVGWSSFTLKYIHYKRIGNLVMVWFCLDGASNDTTVSFTLPFNCTTVESTYQHACGVVTQDSATYPVGRAYIDAGSNTVYVKINWDNSWASSGTKRVAGTLLYEIEV